MGHNITTLDDLSSGYEDSVTYGRFVIGNCGNKTFLFELLAEGFDCVLHFASFIEVSESVKAPAKYYKNNFVDTLNLLDAMRVHNINYLIFLQLQLFLVSQYTHLLMKVIQRIL